MFKSSAIDDSYRYGYKKIGAWDGPENLEQKKCWEAKGVYGSSWCVDSFLGKPYSS
jgi:hypothetical protein